MICTESAIQCDDTKLRFLLSFVFLMLELGLGNRIMNEMVDLMNLQLHLCNCVSLVVTS